MRNCIDFHTHSFYSDGTASPRKVVELADAQRLAAVALTDHDTVAGVPEFLALQPEYPELKLYSGVEISTSYNNREIHIVGIGVDCESESMREFLENMRRERVVRAEKMALKLASLGYPLPEEEWRSLDVVGRMHFGKMLLEHYKFTSLDDVFVKLLRRGMPAYVARELPYPEESIRQIHAAGGVAIWAHPVFAQAGERGWVKRVLKRMIPAGLDGMEVYYACFSPEQITMIKGFAEEYKLLFSGGSDYHGVSPHGTEIGCGRGNLEVPASLLGPIDERLAQIRAEK